MLQEGHIWTRERQERWEKTREKGCWAYVLRMTVIAFLATLAVSLIYCGVTLAGGGEIQLPTALGLPVLGILSGLILGRAYWGMSEGSFEEMRSR